MQITKNQIINILLNLIIVSTIFLPFYNFEFLDFSGGIKGTFLDDIFIVPLAAIISIGIIILNKKNTFIGGILTLIASLYFILKLEFGAESASSSASIGLGLFLMTFLSILNSIPYKSYKIVGSSNSIAKFLAAFTIINIFYCFILVYLIDPSASFQLSTLYKSLFFVYLLAGFPLFSILYIKKTV